MGQIALNKNLEDFLRGYSKLETPDEKIEHKVEGSLMFEGHEEVMKQYEEMLAIDEWLDAREAILRTYASLQPEQINTFLQTTVKYEPHKWYAQLTGRFLTRLIRNSHYAGKNNFMLNTKALSKDIDCLGFDLKGRGINKLELTINGNVGEKCCAWAENIGKVYISGSAKSCCGQLANDIGLLHIGEDAGSCCGISASEIGVLYIGRNAGNCCGGGARSIGQIYIGGLAKKKCGDETRCSTFKTPNKQTLQLLKKNVPKRKRFGNRIFFIHPDKHEEEIKW
ncbi:MAG: hypothetical protein ABIB71_06415 [Candidatus Woesearchaeota archaeon]